MNGKTHAMRLFLASLIMDGYECTIDEGRANVRSIVVTYADDLEVERKVLRTPGRAGIRCCKDGASLLIATRDGAAAHELLASALNEMEFA